jgi:predicted nucleic acid-binding protein
MPTKSSLVINSSPLIALGAALPNFTALNQMIGRLIVPAEVLSELRAGDAKDATADVVRNSCFCDIRPPRLKPFRALLIPLGSGEAAVIETALEEGLPTVVIDELKGRRFARLCGLHVIGSLGILVEAYRAGIGPTVEEAARRMKAKGIYLSEWIIQQAAAAACKPN